jgi:hypothetical protein
MYLLDANVFIQAHRLHYGFDICPAFWEWIERAHDLQRVFSIGKVLEEIEVGNDALAEWASNRPESFFLKPEPATVLSLQATSGWAVRSGSDQTAISTFLQVADYFLVAQAHSLSFTVVTHEVPGSSRKRIKVPDACIGVGVQFMTPFSMLRREQARFVLA